ncbi:MAG TPA: hypothetical protein VGS11_08010 [Candidatus Bathyarchaeia archaeon]|nr:hypothetical protein [Candidatus Bathyarchaeia archaeon]
MTTPLFLIAYPHASADQTGEDGLNSQEREDTIAEANQTIFIHSTVQNRTVENNYGLLFSSVNGISLHMESSSTNEVREIENPTNQALRISYASLILFNDTDGNGVYDPGHDMVVQTIDLQAEKYASPIVGSVESQDGKQGYMLVSRSADGLLTVTTETFPTTAQVNGATVLPTTTIVGVSINSTLLPKPADHIALMTDVMTGSTGNGPATGSNSVTVKSGGNQQFVSWTPTGTVNDQQVAVRTSTKTTSNTVTIGLSYPIGNRISQGMLLGVLFGTTPLVTTGLIIGSSIAALILLGFLLAAGRREYSRAYLRRV